MKATAKTNLLLFVCLFASLVLSGCSSDVAEVVSEVPEAQTPTRDDNEPIVAAGAEDFTLQLGFSSVTIVEGNQVEIPITVSRADGYVDDITLSLAASSEADATSIVSQFSDSTLSAGEETSDLRVILNLSALPIQPQSRNLIVRAIDAAGQASSASLLLDVQPTSAPDVYLLIGQSNMVGNSEDDGRESGPGEPDQPFSSIQQLNVTGNDAQNFSADSDFVTPASLYNTGTPLSIALDPLHSGLEGDGNKTGTRIGLGLSFAKSALANTTADIYLVPAAWSDTGFCKRDTNRLPGIGWNATEKDNSALAGTLLYDRAIVRVNSTLELTGGVLRGILWHQGEADSDNIDCAITYADNLTEMVQALRTNIAEDARGPEARSPDADIPFVVGTMSKGGDQAPFPTTKLIVDGVHRNVASLIPFSNFVNSDDLVPPSYGCGAGTCIHFGSDALREMGNRYYDQMISVLQ